MREQLESKSVEVAALKEEGAELRGALDGSREEVQGLRGELKGSREEADGLRGELEGVRGGQVGVLLEEVAMLKAADAEREYEAASAEVSTPETRGPKR